MKTIILGSYVGSAAVAIGLVSILVAGFQHASAAPAVYYRRAPVSAFNHPYPPGVPAIQLNRRTSAQGEVAFGQAEVEQFVASHSQFIGVRPEGDSGKVVKVNFITAAQASAQMNGEWVGRPDDAIVCWVEVLGPLDITGVSAPAVSGINTSMLQPAEREILIFDAQTGNFLMRTWQDH